MKNFLATVLFVICLNLNIQQAAALSVDAADSDVRELITAVAAQGGLSVLLGGEVQGNISLKLTDMQPKEIIRAICGGEGYIFREEDGVIYVNKSGAASLHNIKVDYLDLEKAAQMAELFLAKGSLKTESGRENKEKNAGQAKWDKPGAARVVVDADSSALVFYGSGEEAAGIRSFIKSVDKAPRQVSLEAKVTAVQKDAEKDLGVSWEWSKLPQSPEHDITYDTIRRTVENSDGSFSQITEYIPVDEVTRSWEGGGNVPGVIRFGKGPEGFPYEFYYAAQLNALISDGKADILARPNITTVQGNEAVINIGSEVPVPTVSTTDSTVTTSVQYREAGIILKCTPRVNEDGIITVKVHTEVSSPLYVEDMKAYRFQKRSADTTVRLRDGETMVIGGLIGSDEARQMSKIPFLGDIPILGNLFKHIQKSKSDTEVMIFLTAREVK